MSDAPYHKHLAKGLDTVVSQWVTTPDGKRLRAVHWPADASRGTVLLFSGRTEYAEKYGLTASDILGQNLSLVTVDWRGQGLSDRVAKNPDVGHIDGFASYQLDVAAFIQFATEQNCPKPWYMIAHSMGGCIGLRALIEGVGVEKAVFSAPMWGINLPVWVRPLPYFVPRVLAALGKGEGFAPGAGHENYVIATPFQDNMLTTDAETYGYLLDQVKEVPEFALAGPSSDWVGHAAWETRALRRDKRPKVPTLTFVGSDEDIVSTSAIKAVHENWPSAELREIQGARHEIMMEAPPKRQRFITETLEFFAA